MSRTPASLIEQEIPETFASKKDQLSDEQKAASLTIGVSIDGNEWTLAIDGGELTVDTSLAGNCDITVVTDGDSFDLAINNEEAAAFDPSRINPARVKAAMADQIKTFSGTIRGAILDAGDELAFVTIKLGADAPDEPTTSIKVEEDDVRKIATGKLLPQQAFMSGRVLIEGDMALAMQLSTLFMM